MKKTEHQQLSLLVTSRTPVNVFVGLGSNLGDREGFLERARSFLGLRVGRIVRVSSIIQTAPWGGIPQPDYLNQVVWLQTKMKPEPLMRCLLSFELECGRVREQRWGARTLDLDMLYYGNFIIHNELLQVPHPRLHERSFVMESLLEIAPRWHHPVLKKRHLNLWVSGQ